MCGQSFRGLARLKKPLWVQLFFTILITIGCLYPLISSQLEIGHRLRDSCLQWITLRLANLATSWVWCQRNWKRSSLSPSPRRRYQYVRCVYMWLQYTPNMCSSSLGSLVSWYSFDQVTISARELRSSCGLKNRPSVKAATRAVNSMFKKDGILNEFQQLACQQLQWHIQYT